MSRKIASGVLGWCLFCASTVQAAWQSGTLSTQSQDFLSVAIGDPGNSGSVRVYGANADDTLYELIYGSGWGPGNNLSPGHGAAVAIQIDNLRNDSTMRLAAAFNQASGEVYAFRYASGWVEQLMGSTGDVNTCLTVGSARGDSAVRTYVGNNSGALAEFSWNGAVYDANTVTAATLPGSLWSLAIGAGRNGSAQTYLYATEDSHWYEFKWNGSAWRWEKTSELPNTPTARAMVLGDLRQDGKIRVYLGNENGEILELNYNGGWQGSTLMGGMGKIRGLAAGDGRNDGVSRLYAVSTDKHAYELTWSGSSWGQTDLGAISGSGLTSIALGAGRNGDGNNYLYIGSANNRLYECYWEAPTPVASATPRFTPSQTPSASPTPTSTSSRTPPFTRTSTFTQTMTSTSTHTLSPTPTLTVTFTATSTRTVTSTRTATPIRSATPTYTRSLTYTITPTYTMTPTASVTPTMFIPTDLEHLVVYPNPFRADRNARNRINFYLLPTRAEVQVFTLTGSLVWKMEKNNSDNQIAWDLTNTEGRAVASGTYLYIVKSDGQSRRGKFAVIR